MSPTYSSGSMNFINKLAYVRHAPERGDIIALATTDELLLKRIVALPGEQVDRLGNLGAERGPWRDNRGAFRGAIGDRAGIALGEQVVQPLLAHP